MDAQPCGDTLHLPSLWVKGLLGIPELTIPQLGRVTLLVGKNGVGKSTLLDAVRIYAARGDYSVLASVLESRDEIAGFTDDDGDGTPAPNLEALFYGRNPGPESAIAIGPAGGKRKLLITAKPGIWGEADTHSWRDDAANDDLPLLGISFGGVEQEGISASIMLDARRRWLRRRRSEGSMLFLCQSLGPNAPENDDIAQFWDKVALTPDEGRAVEALRPIYGDAVQRVAAIADPRSRYERRLARYARRLVVSRKDRDTPVPLRSLGEGAVRIFGIALALANSKGGFLLIDEVENGLHYSVQSDFWKMVLQAARDNDVQVLATTHNWDVVLGFTEAATEMEEVDGVLIRLTRRREKLFATTFEERELSIATRNRLEVR